MQYCTKCGGLVPKGVFFCATCGQKIGGAQSVSPDKPKQYDSMVPATLGNTRDKQALWWGIGIFGIFIVAGLITFFAIQFTKSAHETPAPLKVETKDPVLTPPSQGVSGLINNAPVNGNELADFRIYVQAKERINTEIIELASQINSRLNENGTLRYSQDLRNRARLTTDDIAQYSSKLSNHKYPPEFQSAKSLLLQLFDLETTRARSLYNGLTEGINSQDFQSSFSVGTRAAYEFDDMNARFVQEYSSLDKR